MHERCVNPLRFHIPYNPPVLYISDLVLGGPTPDLDLGFAQDLYRRHAILEPVEPAGDARPDTEKVRGVRADGGAAESRRHHQDRQHPRRRPLLRHHHRARRPH